jgi:hypothetical protein
MQQQSIAARVQNIDRCSFIAAGAPQRRFRLLLPARNASLTARSRETICKRYCNRAETKDAYWAFSSTGCALG